MISPSLKEQPAEAAAAAETAALHSPQHPKAGGAALTKTKTGRKKGLFFPARPGSLRTSFFASLVYSKAVSGDLADLRTHVKMTNFSIAAIMNNRRTAEDKRDGESKKRKLAPPGETDVDRDGLARRPHTGCDLRAGPSVREDDDLDDARDRDRDPDPAEDGDPAGAAPSPASTTKRRKEEKPKMRSKCNSDDLRHVACVLETKDLWEKFHDLETEMIITKTGR